jgi:hypothetical protein
MLQRDEKNLPPFPSRSRRLLIRQSVLTGAAAVPRCHQPSRKHAFVYLVQKFLDSLFPSRSPQHGQWCLPFEPILRARQPLSSVVAISINTNCQSIDPRHPSQPIRLVDTQWLPTLPAVLQRARWNDDLDQFLQRKARVSSKFLQRSDGHSLLDRLPVKLKRPWGNRVGCRSSHKDIMPHKSRHFVPCPSLFGQTSHKSGRGAGCPRSGSPRTGLRPWGGDLDSETWESTNLNRKNQPVKLQPPS